MPKPAPSPAGQNRYQALLEKVFFANYSKGCDEVPLSREELDKAADELGVERVKNLGDIIYSARYRTPLPPKILDLQPKGKEWIIVGRGKSKYAFKLAKISRIVPNTQLVTLKIPEATPEIVTAYAMSDEQALLAKVRYNRLIDLFLGITAYSLQNHLRTSLKETGQIEIDEIYVGVDKGGRQYIIPVQAKGGSDQLGSVQAQQDLSYCAAKFPDLICRAISAQFLDEKQIALMELVNQDGEVKVANEAHYRLVPASQISKDDLAQYRTRKAD